MVGGGAGDGSRFEDEFWWTSHQECVWFSTLIFDPCNTYEQLEVLRLDNSKGLQRPFPFELSMLSTVRKIDLSGSQFHGTIPTGRIGSPELEALLLHDDEFPGVIAVLEIATRLSQPSVV
jgi:hypothetical protein